MQLSDSAILLLGLVLAAWVAAAGYAVITGLAMRRRAEAATRLSRRLSQMIDQAPALPLLVRADGRLEGPDRLARWFGLEVLPAYLSELGQDNVGLEAADLAHLTAAITAAQKTGKPFRHAASVKGSHSALVFQGAIANPQISPSSAALLWIFDATDSEGQIAALRHDVTDARAAFAALSGLIEAAPMPMWFRTPDLHLSLVNAAYVDAVEGSDAVVVARDGVELVEPVDGVSPMAIAGRAQELGEMVERTVSTTIKGVRRTMRVTDLPLGDVGIAGFAIDVQDLEEERSSFARFRQSQRGLLDIMSAGFVQFDAERELLFSNQPFQRIFAMRQQWLQEGTAFERLLDRMREAGRLPEVRDFPAWREEKKKWFRLVEAAEENWILPDGTHLRVIAHPMPDNGLLLIFEDRTEQVQLASARDTLLRARTATFDNLFESLAVFAPDGKLHLWNRRFSDVWELEEAALAEHPRVDDLMRMLAPKLRRPAQISVLRDVVRAATAERDEKSGRLDMGNGRTYEFAGIPLPDGNALFTMLDVSDSQRMEQALRDRNDALVEADAIKGKFLANMSYEFRTPLTSIGGFAELLAAGLAGPLSEQGKDYVDAILASVERLGSQINNVLDLSQSEAGALPLAKENVAVQPFLSGLVTERSDAVEARQLDLEVRLDTNLGNVAADPKRLAQAIGNVLDNSIGFTPPKGRVLIQADRSGKRLRIIISDNGPGMDTGQMERALDGFAQSQRRKGRDASKANEARSGLGLPLAKQLIEAHGGKLQLVSEPGQGTLVTITLPCG